jgi:hypothetical protein
MSMCCNGIHNLLCGYLDNLWFRDLFNICVILIYLRIRQARYNHVFLTHIISTCYCSLYAYQRVCVIIPIHPGFRLQYLSGYVGVCGRLMRSSSIRFAPYLHTLF